MKVRVNLTIEPDTKAKMESLAQGTHLSQGEVVDNAVRLYASSLPPSRGGRGRMNFQEMPLGAIFVTKDGGDGQFGQHLYKVSDTEAVTMANYTREQISPEAEYLTTGEFVTIHTTPTELERAALTEIARYVSSLWPGLE